MRVSARYTLLHGAHGIDLGPVAIVFANEKIVVAERGSRTHLTVHMGPRSGVLDLHETQLARDGSKTRTRLFTISRENLELLLRELAPHVMRCMKDLLRPLRVGWMARSRVAAVVGLPPSDADLGKVSDKRHKKLVVNAAKLAARVTFPEFLEELYDLRDGDSFMLFDARNPGSPRRLGIGFKHTDPRGRPRLTWFRFSDVADVLSHLEIRLRDAALRYGQFHQPLPWFPNRQATLDRHPSAFCDAKSAATHSPQ